MTYSEEEILNYKERENHGILKRGDLGKLI